MYSESKYMVSEYIINILLGGRSWFSLNLGIFRMHAFLDVVGGKYTPLKMKTKYNVLKHDEACLELGWSGEAMKLKSYA